MAVAKEFVRGLPFVIQVSDLLADGHRDPRQLLRADAGAFRQLANMLVKLCNTMFHGELLEQQEEDNVVREDNDLPGLGFLHQPPRHTLAPFVIERGYRIVEHDAGGIIGGAEFRKERRYRQAALLAFAHDPRQFGTGRAGQDEFVIENAVCSAGFLEFDLDVAESEICQLVLEALLELLRNGGLRDGRALLRDGVGCRLVEAQPVGRDSLLAFDFVQNERLMLGEQFAGAQLLRLRSCVCVFPQSRWRAAS
jgi:hypothetical protein